MRTCLIAALALAGCSTSDDSEPCRDGFEPAADGHCYPPPNPWPEPDIHDALDHLPACESTSPDGEIDLANGCASGACVSMSELEISTALGDIPDCTRASWSDTKQYCLWPIGIEGLFDDLDEDGWPDEEASNERIHVIPPYGGQTAAGSGVAVGVSCYIDELGYPDAAVYYDIAGMLMIQDLIYDRYGVKAYDWGDDNDTSQPDGRIDNLYLYGAP